MGPRTVPCGTPELTVANEEQCPSTTTIAVFYSRGRIESMLVKLITSNTIDNDLISFDC